MFGKNKKEKDFQLSSEDSKAMQEIGESVRRETGYDPADDGLGRAFFMRRAFDYFNKKSHEEENHHKSR